VDAAAAICFNARRILNVSTGYSRAQSRTIAHLLPLVYVKISKRPSFAQPVQNSAAAIRQLGLPTQKQVGLPCNGRKLLPDRPRTKNCRQRRILGIIRSEVMVSAAPRGVVDQNVQGHIAPFGPRQQSYLGDQSAFENQRCLFPASAVAPIDFKATRISENWPIRPNISPVVPRN